MENILSELQKALEGSRPETEIVDKEPEAQEQQTGAQEIHLEEYIVNMFCKALALFWSICGCISDFFRNSPDMLKKDKIFGFSKNSGKKLVMALITFLRAWACSYKDMVKRQMKKGIKINNENPEKLPAWVTSVQIYTILVFRFKLAIARVCCKFFDGVSAGVTEFAEDENGSLPAGVIVDCAAITGALIGSFCGACVRTTIIAPEYKMRYTYLTYRWLDERSGGRLSQNLDFVFVCFNKYCAPIASFISEFCIEYANKFVIHVWVKVVYYASQLGKDFGEIFTKAVKKATDWKLQL